MAELKIPLRPSTYDKSVIKKNDADCLTYSVLLGGKNEDAFRLFHPQYIDGSGKLSMIGKEKSRQFFFYAKNREYIDNYKSDLEKFLKGNGLGEKPTVIDDSRKDKALKSLLNQAMRLVEEEGDLDPDTLKTVTDIFKRLSIIKEEEVVEVPPIRYLPERCSSCRYKLFIDENVANGNIIKEEGAE